jgi:hypothetical protein
VGHDQRDSTAIDDDLVAEKNGVLWIF